jgi:hypothetical protein
MGAKAIKEHWGVRDIAIRPKREEGRRGPNVRQQDHALTVTDASQNGERRAIRHPSIALCALCPAPADTRRRRANASQT